MSEQDITIIRLELLRILEAASPFGLKERRLVSGLQYAGYKVTPAELAMHKRALVDARLIRVEDDLINAADTLHYFTEAARVYLSKQGL